MTGGRGGAEDGGMPKRPRLVRGKDYTVEDGQFEFTREYLLSLGMCCKNECRYCPYREQDDARAEGTPAGKTTNAD